MSLNGLTRTFPWLIHATEDILPKTIWEIQHSTFPKLQVLNLFL